MMAEEKTVRVLVVGDVVGGPGRAAFAELYPRIREERGVEFCIVNAENAAGGSGLTVDTAEELLRAGADVLTSGDHIWRREEAVELLNGNPKVLRPLNFPPGAPGRGSRVSPLPGGGEIAVVSLLGRVFMAPMDCPFRHLEGEVNVLSRRTRLIVVDFHAEATSEKAALARHFDGRVSAVVGTHTHVPTADARILAGKTAFISDIGMCGSLDSILGREPRAVITAFLTGRPVRFPVAAADPGLQGVLLELDRESGHALDISAVNYGGNEIR
ncbi:MAG TPA: TIGR00282 family metallophosphoesterase [bacterium]|nr:TIGR00282 family metallophosphoesterase [bacterium]HPQ66181.1 TIGR00282 family metallophosphoesterase [bacterium]